MTEHNRLIGAVSLLLAAILVAACASSGSLKCTARSDGTGECTGTVQFMVQKASSSSAVDQYDLASFNANNLKADTSSSNVRVKSASNPYTTISLYNNGSLVARKNFNMVVNGDNITPANPSAVSTWVQSYSNTVDDFRISYSGVDFALQDGSNNFVLEWYYENSQLGGNSDSLYHRIDGDGYCDGSICYEPK